MRRAMTNKSGLIACPQGKGVVNLLSLRERDSDYSAGCAEACGSFFSFVCQRVQDRKSTGSRGAPGAGAGSTRQWRKSLRAPRVNVNMRRKPRVNIAAICVRELTKPGPSLRIEPHVSRWTPKMRCRQPVGRWKQSSNISDRFQARNGPPPPPASQPNPIHTTSRHTRPSWRRA